MAPKLAKAPKHPNNIRKVIEQSSWKFYEVAVETKIPRDTLSDYCAGKYPIPKERLQALAEFLNCLPEYLVPPLPNVRNTYESHSQSEETKDLEALLVLRTHCEAHPTDENALQQLMELLGKFGRYREIEACYERFLKAIKKEDIWRKPDTYTTQLLAQLRAQKALDSEKVGQAVQTKEAVLKDPATHAQEVPAHPQTSSSDQKEEPPSPPTASPAIPSDTERTTEGTRETVTQSGPIQVVVLVSPSSSYLDGTIPKIRVLEKGDNDTDPLRRKLGGLFKQAAQVSIVGALAPEFLGRPDLLERLERAVTRPSLIDATFLGQLRSSVTNCWKLQPEIAGVVSFEHLNTVHAHLAYLIELLESSLDPSVRKPLTSLAAECALMLGKIYHTMQFPTVAERYYTAARIAAEEAGNQAFKAVILGRMSILPNNRPLDIFQEALPLAQKYGTKTTYSWLLATKSLHLSVDPQYATECEKTLEQVTTFSFKGDPEHDPYWTGFDQAQMYSYQGSCYISLRKSEAAKTALLRGLQLTDPHALGNQEDLQVNLAEVYQLQGDIVNACLHGHRVLSLISRTHSPWYLPWLEDFRSKFPAGETKSALQAFDEHKMSVEELLRQHTHFEKIL